MCAPSAPIWGTRSVAGPHLTALRRTASAGFTLDDAVGLDALEALGRQGRGWDRIIGMSAALRGMPAAKADRALAQRIRTGQQLTEGDLPPTAGDGPVKIVDAGERLLAGGHPRQGTPNATHTLACSHTNRNVYTRRKKEVVLSTEDKKNLIDRYKLHDSDTGSPEVQVGLLTERITYLTGASQGSQEGPSQSARAVDAGRPPSASAQLRQGQGRRPLPQHHRNPRVATIIRPLPGAAVAATGSGVVTRVTLARGGPLPQAGCHHIAGRPIAAAAWGVSASRLRQRIRR